MAMKRKNNGINEKGGMDYRDRFVYCVVDSVGNTAFEACIEGWGHARPFAFSCMGKQKKDCDR